MATSQYSRRDFLHLGWTLGAGLVLPAGLYGCFNDSDSESFPPLPEETFVQPPTLASVDGALSVTLQLSYFTTVLNGKAVTLRSMNNRIPAPTLRVNVGDTLRILVVNQLPPNPPTVEPAQHLRYPNSTNLHTHGLHVTPGLVAPGVYGDFVMDDPRLGSPAGTSPAARIPHRPRSPAGRVLVSPALARIDRDPDRQRHGRRADH